MGPRIAKTIITNKGARTMTIQVIDEIKNLCEDCESNIDIDKAVSENNEYQIGIWDLCQQLKEIVLKGNL